MERRKTLKNRNTKKIFIIMLTLFLVMHFGEYFVKNYAYRWLDDEGVDREMKLTYLGALDVDISLSDVFSQDAESYNEYTNCWKISDLKDYNYFSKEIGLNETRLWMGVCLLNNSYLISYGRKLEKAVYNSKDYWECGYWVEFTFDETDYCSDVVYVYKTDRIRVGNIMYLM